MRFLSKCSLKKVSMKKTLLLLSITSIFACSKQAKMDYGKLYQKEAKALSDKYQNSYQISDSGSVHLFDSSRTEKFCFYKSDKSDFSTLRIYSDSSVIFEDEIYEIYNPLKFEIRKLSDSNRENLLVFGEIKTFQYNNQSLIVYRGDKEKVKTVFSKTIYWKDDMTTDSTILTVSDVSFQKNDDLNIEEIVLYKNTIVEYNDLADTMKSEILHYYFDQVKRQYLRKSN